MSALDIIGSLCFFGARVGSFVIPLVEGSEWSDGTRKSKPRPGSPFVGCVNSVSGLCLPWIVARARVHANWCNRSTLSLMLSRGGALGQMSNIGQVRWQLANAPAVQYAACKLAGISFLFDARPGNIISPLVCEMLFRPYGYRVLPRSGFPPLPIGRAWMSQGVTFSGFSGVLGGAFTVDTRLSPNTSSPHYGSFDGEKYPVNYTNGDPDVSFDVAQYSDAALTRDGNDPDQQYGMTVFFRSPDRQSNVNFTLNTLAPRRNQRVQLRVGGVNRSYTGIHSNRISPQVVIGGT